MRLRPAETQRSARTLAYLGGAAAVLGALVCFVFRRHLAGTAIFPWDFVGGYYGEALAWYRQGGFFSPPEWFAQGNFGFPAWTALQDSAWFIPDSLISSFRGPLTLEDVTRLQVALVFISGLGIYALARLFRMGLAVALLVAAAYMLSGGFFSNAEHVDILRGYALLPWLAVALHCRVLNRRWGPAFAAVVVFQYLIAAYPGQVVSAFYVLAIYVVWQWRESRQAQQSWLYVGGLVAACLAGLLLSALKWWPLFVSRTLMLPGDDYAAAGISGIKLLTLFFPSHAGPLVDRQITLMTVFIGPAIVTALFFIRSLRSERGVMALMAIVSLSMGSMLFDHAQWLHWLPGTSISRMAILDYRGTLDLALVILAGLILEDWQASRPTRRELCLRMAAATVIYAAIAVLGLHLGWGAYVACIAAFLVCVPLIGLLGVQRSTPVVWMLMSALIAVDAATAYVHAVNLKPAWDFDPQRYQQRFYGGSIDRLVQQPLEKQWPSRPARLVVPADVLSGQQEAAKKSPLYNREWYTGGFAAFGADNVKRFIPHAELYQAFSDERSTPDRPLLAFMLDSSRVALLNPAMPFNSHQLQADSGRHAGPDGYGSAYMKGFRLDGSDYELNLTAPVRLVENEIWYPGWHGMLVGPNHGQVQQLDAQPFGPYLRSWLLPAGQWRLSTSYRTPGGATSWWLFWFGATTVVLWTFMGLLIRRRPASTA